MIDNWQSVVKSWRCCVSSGDVLFGHNKVEWLEANFTKLNGTKHLILGNHDNPKFPVFFFKSISLWAEFDNLVASPAPMHELHLQSPYRFSKNILNIHGHIHSNPSPEGPYKCVSVEQINYTPVNIEELI